MICIKMRNVHKIEFITIQGQTYYFDDFFSVFPDL